MKSSDRTISALQVKLVPSAVLNGLRVRLLVNWDSDKDDAMKMWSVALSKREVSLSHVTVTFTSLAILESKSTSQVKVRGAPT